MVLYASYCNNIQVVEIYETISLLEENKVVDVVYVLQDDSIQNHLETMFVVDDP